MLDSTVEESSGVDSVESIGIPDVLAVGLGESRSVLALEEIGGVDIPGGGALVISAVEPSLVRGLLDIKVDNKSRVVILLLCTALVEGRFGADDAAGLEWPAEVNAL